MPRSLTDLGGLNVSAEDFLAAVFGDCRTADAEQGNAELRELAHGILPSALTLGGLRASVDACSAPLDLPVQVDVPAERFPAEVEASGYFIVAEALTNVVKHSHAERAEVRVSVDDDALRVEVRDDGAEVPIRTVTGCWGWRTGPPRSAGGSNREPGRWRHPRSRCAPTLSRLKEQPLR